MRPLLSLVSATILLCAGSPGGQVVLTDRAPVDLGAFDATTGSFVDAPAPPDASQVFDNRTPNGAAYFPNTTQLLVMDWGDLAARPENEVFAADIGYATFSQTPVDLTLRLHALAEGSGDPGPVLYTIPVTGLPGSPDGQMTLFTTQVSFDALVLPDGPIGWSYQAGDVLTGFILAQPGVESGIEDLLDLYETDLSLRDQISFGPEVFASTYLGLVGSYPGVHGWPVVGSALPGTAGHASLLGAGEVASDTANLIDLSGALPGVVAFIVVGAVQIDAPFKGGVLIPAPILVLPAPTGPTGGFQWPWALTGPVAPGLDLWFQVWFPDGGNPQGWASTAGVRATST